MLWSLWVLFLTIFSYLLCVFKRDPLTFLLVSTFFLSIAGTVGLGQLFIYVSDYIQSSAANSSVSAASSAPYLSSTSSPYYYPISSNGHSTSRLLDALSQVLSNGTTSSSDPYSSLSTAAVSNITSYPSSIYYNDVSSLAFTSSDSFNSSFSTFSTSSPSTSSLVPFPQLPSCPPVPNWDDLSSSFPGDWSSISYYTGIPSNYCDYKRISASWYNGLFKLGLSHDEDNFHKFSVYSNYVYANDKFFETFYNNPANINADPLVAYFHRLGHAVRRSVSSVPLSSSSAPFITDSQAVACVVAFVFLKFLVIHMIG